MCGIFGGIGNNVNPGIIRALALINRERGEQSLGFFDNTGKIIKQASDPLRCLAFDNFSNYIDRACSKGWFLAGHTRYATRGALTDKNAHPFRYGNVVGAHNGIVDAPKEYTVDSQYLIDSLHRAGGDYQKALETIDGYWGLTWFDGAAFWIQSHNQDIAMAELGGAWYYSSDKKHLAACLGHQRIREMEEGETIKFELNTLTPINAPALESFGFNYWDRRATATQGGYGWSNWTSSKDNGKKGKKGKKSKKAVESVLEGMEDQIARMDWEDADYADDLAQASGYTDFYDFMLKEGIGSAERALRMLEDAQWVDCNDKKEDEAEAEVIDWSDKPDNWDDDDLRYPRVGFHI